MATERWMQIRCDDCGDACESVDVAEMRESELRKDLKQRLGWLSYKTAKGYRDVCPACLERGK